MIHHRHLFQYLFSSFHSVSLFASLSLPPSRLSLSLAFLVHPCVSPKHHSRYFFVTPIQVLLFSFSFYSRILFRFIFSNSLICLRIFLHFTISSQPFIVLPRPFSLYYFFLYFLKLTSFYGLFPFRAFLPPFLSC